MANKKIVRYRRTIPFNIGFVFFFMIILYVIFYMISYFTSSHISEYEVTQGTIKANNIYRGLVLRDETVYYAETAGYINYYLKNRAKASVNDVIFSIDTDGAIASKINAASKDVTNLDTESSQKIGEEISTFITNYDSVAFSQIYSFKDELNSELSQNLSSGALVQLEDVVASAQLNHTFFPVKPEVPGVVLYYVDGLESVTPDTFEPEDLQIADYKKSSLLENQKIKKSQAVCKLVSTEDWNIILMITEELAEKLEEDDTIRIRFCKDGYTVNAGYSLLQREGNYYLNLSLSNGMIRYANERFLDIELVLNVEDGLKIPNSAITTKEFFTVPKNYFTTGADSDKQGILVSRIIDDKQTVEFVTPTIYYEANDQYYIDETDVVKGEVIVRSDSSETYTIGSDVAELEGVYNINKGYAVFRQIEILYQNTEYSIVKKKTNYGIALYDHIALEGDKIHENQFTVN